MRDTDAAWLAGLIDGEGSLMIRKESRRDCSAPTYDAAVAVTNTDRRLVERCQSLAGGKINSAIPKNPKHREAHALILVVVICSERTR